MNITIPTSIEEAKASLDGLGKLLTAKEWERAAIVYAFTVPSQGSRHVGTIAPKLTINGFAKLGITGLRSHEDVTAYRKAWESAIQDGAAEAIPGATIDLPNLPWKSVHADTNRGQGAVEERSFKRILKDPERLAKIVEDSETADAVAEAVLTPAIRWRVIELLHHDEQQHEPAPAHRPAPASAAVEKVIHAVQTFFDTEIVHNGESLAYRDIIRTVAESGDARELYRLSIVPTPLGVVLREALEELAHEATSQAGQFQLEAGETREVSA